METLTSILKYAVFGFFGLIAVLIVVAVLFGKRIRKQWEFEADFRDADGREFGEFEIEMSRIDKEEQDFTIKGKLRMRHAALSQHASVQVFIEDALVMETRVETEGRVYVQRKKLVHTVDAVSAGQVCRVLVGGNEIASAEFHPD